jgi:hypothetical protein
MVRLSVIDNDGTKHTFVLDNCLYHPDSPVNLLSMRHLAEKFIDGSRNPNEEMRIESRYSTHVLIWSFGQFRKTFPTPISDLPELLFDKGFQEYKSFCMQLSSFANSVSSSNDNTLGSNVILFDDDEVHASADESDDDIDTLFMFNETIVFKDGKGLTRQVTYLGPHILDKVLKHKIRTQNDTDFLVDAILLSLLNAQDIGAFPVTVEQYVAELPKLTHQQIEQILNPQTLDDNQQEFMALHFKMNHLLFSAMITLAENKRINKKFVWLKHRLPICMSCIFGTSHRKPWHTKGAHGSICKDSDDAPGKCVSMDQLVSAQPGLIPQMAGFLMNLCTWGATIFVDHFLDFVFVALMRDLTLDEALLAKTSFERNASDGGVTINSY